MEPIEIYFDDLSAEKQAEIIEKLGNNGNYDIYPIATIEVEEEVDLHPHEAGYSSEYRNYADDMLIKALKEVNEAKED